MKKIMLCALALAAGLAAPRAKAAETLRVVATIPELVDITQRVGGGHVKVDGLAKGGEDIHQVTMRPSFVPKLNRADAVVYLGLTVEHAFLPGLLEVAANPKMRSAPAGCTGPGCIDCSKGLYVLEKPATLSRAEGELHPNGNPHYNVNPDNGALIAKNIAEGLERIDPAHKDDYAKGLKAYLAELDAKLAEWRRWVEPLKGIKAVSYHLDMPYLAKFTGLEFVGTVELKPGVAPTPTHLEELVNQMRQDGVKLIVREQQYDSKLPNWLAERTGAKVATVGTMANSVPGSETFIKLQEANLRAILAALGKQPS